jgi:LuxR family maltose regulon positive regulatory protein
MDVRATKPLRTAYPVTEASQSGDPTDHPAWTRLGPSRGDPLHNAQLKYLLSLGTLAALPIGCWLLARRLEVHMDDPSVAIPAEPSRRSTGTPPPSFVPPPLPLAHCARGRLLNLLRPAVQPKLTAIIGPAGSGKTTLASCWVRAGLAAGPVAWLTLCADDNSPEVFWAHVLESFRRNVPDLDLGRPAPGQQIHLSAAERLGTRPVPVVLVLDGVEAVYSPAIRSELDLLLRYSASGLRLVVVGRRLRLIPLYRYRLTGELREIGATDLALTADETAEVLHAHDVSLSADQTTALRTSTEGWMTGVCLYARAARTVSALAERDPPGRQEVADYLRTEVLGAQPARVRDLLLRTSILDEVDPALADLLTGRRDGRGILAELTLSNTFVVQVDASRFRVQAPLRTMLRDVLAAVHPSLVQRLHGTAARWYAERKPAAAPRVLAHAVESGDWGYSAYLAVEQLGVAWLLTAPEAQQCRDTLAGLPEERSGVVVELLRSILALARYDAAGARLAVDRARECARGLDKPSPMALLGMSTVELMLARLATDVEAAAAAAGDVDARCRATSTEQAEETRVRVLALSNLGVAQLWAGRFQDARSTLGRAATTIEPGAEYGAHDALGHLALLEMYEGKMHHADKYARESVAVADRGAIPPASRVGAASAALAAVALVWNDLPAARKHAARAIATAGSRADPPTTTTIALLRAWTAGARHDGHRVIVATDEARRLSSGRESPRLITDRIELTALWAHLILDDTASARGCVDRIEEPAEHAVALGYLLEAEGDHARARNVLSTVSMRNARPSTLQYAALALGRLAVAEGDVPAARRALRDALDQGRPERRRRPVSDTGTWARRLLREDTGLADEHNWLNPGSGAATDSSDATPVAEPLTERETDVLRCLTEALSTQDIAAALFLSVNTVKTHLKNIYRKLGTSGRSATARRARELNLLPGPDAPEPA